ncbi:MAG: CRISPR-associated RAMP protein Csx7 [Clostridia bacterium]|nr:CRISPR-associated RAMP protein Csx7 [Clostridia bacterium]
MLFDRFESRTIIKGKIIALKPLHIGASEGGIDPVQVDSPVLKDWRGMPVIPGSSLKGVLRSRVEAILSNPAFAGKWTSCNILDDKGRGTSCNIDLKDIKNENAKARDSLEKISEAIAKQIYDKSCDVCRLFGNGGLASKLQIKDMNYTGEKIKYERRDGVGIDRDTGAAKNGAKYGFQIVPAGAEFDFYLVAENLEEKQAKLLNLVVKLLKDSEISVGGKVSRGLGQIQLTNEEAIEINRHNIAKYYGLE